MSIVITGASGQLGRLTADAVLERADPSELVLVTRTPETLSGYADRGVTVRAGDFSEPDGLREAFTGAEKLLLISLATIGERVPLHLAAIGAAAAAGVRSVAYTSIVNPSDSNPAAAAPDHRATEEALRASGLAWTFLRNSIYADMLLRNAGPALESGRLVTNEGEGRTSYISRADCAAAAAAVLTTDGHDGRAYDLSGPAAVSQADVAALLSELGGTPVAPVYLDDDAWIAAMVEHAGLPEPFARMYATFGIASRRYFHAAVSDAFETLVGRPPQSVREVLAAGLAAGQAAQASAARPSSPAVA